MDEEINYLANNFRASMSQLKNVMNNYMDRNKELGDKEKKER